jgi:D-amino-acid dehydrogenase
MEFAGINLSLSQRRIEAILDAIPLYFQNLDRPQSSKCELWNGLRPLTPTACRTPDVSASSPTSSRQRGTPLLGISLATVTGKLVAEIVEGRDPSHDLTLLNPNRYD